MEKDQNNFNSEYGKLVEQSDLLQEIKTFICNHKDLSVAELYVLLDEELNYIESELANLMGVKMEEKALYLTDTCYIKRNSLGYSLNKKVKSYNKKLKKPIMVWEETYYGTVYQALRSFLDKSVNDVEPETLEEIRSKVLEITDLIETKKQEIKNIFCIYVREC